MNINPILEDLYAAREKLLAAADGDAQKVSGTWSRTRASPGTLFVRRRTGRHPLTVTIAASE